MRRAAKVDNNHAAVRDGLRHLGWIVEDFSAVGGGVPDLYVSIGPSIAFAPPAKSRGLLHAGGWGVWVEVKDKGGKLTPAQAERVWLRTRAPLIVAETVEEVVECIAALRRPRKEA